MSYDIGLSSLIDFQPFLSHANNSNHLTQDDDFFIGHNNHNVITDDGTKSRHVDNGSPKNEVLSKDYCNDGSLLGEDVLHGLRAHEQPRTSSNEYDHLNLL